MFIKGNFGSYVKKGAFGSSAFPINILILTELDLTIGS
jgi:hypothetical protein